MFSYILYRIFIYFFIELLTQLQAEAEIIRKEKKRNTCTGIHKFLHLPQEHSLYSCVLNCEDTVISFPPITNSEISKVKKLKNILHMDRMI